MTAIGTVLAIVLARSPDATDREPQSSAPVATGDVEIHVAGSDADRAWMLAHLAGFVDPLEVAVRYHELGQLDAKDVLDPPSDPQPARARVWIDLQQPDRAMVYVVDAAWERVLVRRLRLVDGLDEVASEEIGTIVESSVRALLDGGSIGVAREQLVARLAPTPAPTPTPTPRAALAPAPRPFAPMITLGAGWAVAGWGAGAVEHGPLAVLELAAAAERIAVGARLEVRYIVPVHHEHEAFVLRLAGGGARASATIAGRASPRVTIEAAVGAGVEIVTARPAPRADDAVAFAATRHVLAVLALGAGPAIALGRGKDRALLRAQLTIDLVPHQLRYITADTRARLFTPWIARPGAAITIAWRRRAS